MPPGLMCLHAHPDDESILTGGILARYADEGFRTRVVTCTDGAVGQIVGEGLDADEIRPRLADVRRDELAGALAILDAGEPVYLGYRDSGMMGEDTTADPRCFWRARVDEAVGRLVGLIREFRPDVFVTYDAFGGYGHPDHIQTSRVGVLAADASGFGLLYPETGPAWRVPKVYLATFPRSFISAAVTEMAARGVESPFDEAENAEEIPLGVPDDEITTAVDVRAWLDRKWRALTAHHSQLAPDSLFLTLPEDLRELAFGTEWFIRHRSHVPVPTCTEDDLFDGLR